jgi:hypothetical protein
MMTPPKFGSCWILWKFVGHDSTHSWTIFIPTCINHLLSWFVQIDFILNSHLWVHLSSILKFSFLFSILELNNTFKIKATFQHWKHLYKHLLLRVERLAIWMCFEMKLLLHPIPISLCNLTIFFLTSIILVLVQGTIGCSHHASN